MHKRLWFALVLLLVIPGLIVTTSCAKKTVKAGPAVQADDAAKKAEAEAARQAELARQRKLEEERLKAQQAQQATASAGEKATFESEHIYFDFDKANLKPEAQEILKRKAEYLKKVPNAKVIIEGHCDERGTDEYNLALGDRRAVSALKYLATLGIAEDRMKTISYGEERPLDPAKNEAAWAKNRRAQFLLQ
ncbi:MAG: peptidoglycan-associated lipoprotein Pal [Desulfobacteraceae bacterium]|nr:MAG: peptidoglycan-associated lipoprotein Pal [Desulfobacteraceae bacterium]